MVDPIQVAETLRNIANYVEGLTDPATSLPAPLPDPSTPSEEETELKTLLNDLVGAIRNLQRAYQGNSSNTQRVQAWTDIEKLLKVADGEPEPLSVEKQGVYGQRVIEDEDTPFGQMTYGG
jgi:hypothetical protein